MSDTTPNALAEGLRETANKHGYGFQYRVLAACHDRLVQNANGSTRSEVIADEIPTSLRGKDFHVDGVLELLIDARSDVRLLMPLECKRVDPAYSSWCFFRKSDEHQPFIFDVYSRSVTQGTTTLAHAAFRTRGDIAVVGMDQKTRFQAKADLSADQKERDRKGNSVGQSFDTALAQSQRGAGGLPEWLDRWRPHPSRTIIIPMIVTTAELHMCSMPLTRADLTSGTMPANMTTEKQGVVYFSANVSRSLMQEAAARSSGDSHDARRVVEHWATRGVVIANVGSLDEGLEQAFAMASRHDVLR